MKMEQYLAYTDYALWEVILNGNGEVQMTKDKDGKEVEVPPITAQQILARKEKEKLRALCLWPFQISNMDKDDLYNNLKVYDADIKGSFGSSSNLHNVAFVSAESTNNTNELNAACSVSTATSHSYQAQEEGTLPMIAEQPRIQETGVDMLGMQQEEATEFALIAFTSNASSSSSLNSEVQSCSKQCEQSYEQLKNLFDEQCEKLRKANLEIVGYQYGLKSIVGQLRVHQQNEVIYEEKIGVLEYDIKDKSNLLKYTQKQLDEALREKEDLKAKLEKFETSSQNLTKLLNSQISVKVKTGLGYDSQFNEEEVLDVKVEEVTETVFDNRSSDEENSLANDRFKKAEGFHAVPPPLTRNYMPRKPDLSFAGLDGSIYKFKISETVTSLSKDVKDAPKTSIAFVEKPKEVRTSAPLIQE
uniref:Uncharacterized protein n=1 Tax=Tanacetum cinerariifolium TaxID=118510 RepID=A0A699ISI0_TANCI|nr:hypothetical protein [Tanacetum cinerariifolium]